jgi:GxxExxY protein
VVVRLTAKGAKEREGKGEEALGRIVLDCAYRVHSVLGPGLLESAYEACLAHEITKHADAERQLLLAVRYDGQEIDAGYRLDLLVSRRVVVELKAVEKLLDLHMAQLLSYLKLGGYKLGYLINFNVPHLKDGIRRVVNDL